MRLKSILGIILLSLAVPAFPGATIGFNINPAGVANILGLFGHGGGQGGGQSGGQGGGQSGGLEQKTKVQLSFNDAVVVQVDGTIMVQHADGSAPTALMTDSTVEKGDTLTCYDQSWVILRDRKGDRIGLDGLNGPTVVNIDELHIEGPDRQIRLLLQKGTLMLRINGNDSRQSFFEINTGSVVTSANDTQARLAYVPGQTPLMTVQYFTGDLSVIDKDHEEKMQVNHCERHWKNGSMAEKDPEPLDELDWTNYNKFFDGEPQVAPGDNNFLLAGS
jgi:hypothetical protein